MSYSYWYSYLNWTIYTCPVTPTPLLKCYPQILSISDISLAYSSSSPLRGRSRKSIKPNRFTLSYFRSLFNDHMRPLYYVTQGYYIDYNFNNLKNFVYMNTWVSFIAYGFHIYFVKIIKVFQTSKYFFKYFLSFFRWTFSDILFISTSQIWGYNNV